MGVPSPLPRVEAWLRARQQPKGFQPSARSLLVCSLASSPSPPPSTGTACRPSAVSSFPSSPPLALVLLPFSHRNPRFRIILSTLSVPLASSRILRQTSQHLSSHFIHQASLAVTFSRPRLLFRPSRAQIVSRVVSFPEGSTCGSMSERERCTLKNLQLTICLSFSQL